MNPNRKKEKFSCSGAELCHKGLESGRVQLKCDGTRWRTGGEVNGETGEWNG